MNKSKLCCICHGELIIALYCLPVSSLLITMSLTYWVSENTILLAVTGTKGPAGLLLCLFLHHQSPPAEPSSLTNSWRPVWVGSGEGETWPTCWDYFWLKAHFSAQTRWQSPSRLGKLNCTDFSAFWCYWKIVSGSVSENSAWIC